MGFLTVLLTGWVFLLSAAQAEYCDFGGRKWTRVNSTYDSLPPGYQSQIYRISGTEGGSKILFDSRSRNLLPDSHDRANDNDYGPVGVTTDVFLFDRATESLKSVPSAFWRIAERRPSIGGSGILDEGRQAFLKYRLRRDGSHAALWDLETDNITVVQEGLYGFAFSDDTRWFAYSRWPGHQSVWLRDRNSDKEDIRVDIGPDGSPLNGTFKRLSRDGRRLYFSTNHDGQRMFYLYDVSSREVRPLSDPVPHFPERVGNSNGIYPMSFEGNRFIFGYENWSYVDLRTGTYQYLPINRGLHGADLDSEGRRMLHADYRSVYIIDLSTGQRENIYRPRGGFSHSEPPSTNWAGDSSILMTTHVDCETGRQRGGRHRDYLYVVDL